MVLEVAILDVKTS